MSLTFLSLSANAFELEFEKAINFLDIKAFANTKKHLKDIEIIVLWGALQGLTYEETAEAYGYSTTYLQQDVGPKIWKLLSEVLGEKVSKKNFKAALGRKIQCNFTNISTHTKISSQCNHLFRNIA
jgi:hypothetical protein